MKTLLLISLLLLSGCIQQQEVQREIEIDTEFNKYIEIFESKTGDKVNITMKLAVIEDKDIIGRCYHYNDKKYNYIEIDPTYWFMELTESEKEEVIFHELGHCIYSRQHDETILNGKDYGLNYFVYKSMMYPYIFGGRVYDNHKEYYMDELKNPNVKLTDYL